jgi:A/G-specific adenine glycosylase
MSQQTRVETVIAYFERWMARFPTVESLAGATDDDVFKLWEGLGYYSRARNLLRAARHVVDAFDGSIPTTSAELATLPGVGAYTSGAIASIAFGERVPAVDGNVLRVLARVLDHDGDIRTTGGRAPIEDAATRLVPPDRPGDFNQALMELGALVCTPRSPRCDVCPVADLCAGRTRADALPVKSPKPKAREEVRVALLLEDADGHILLARNPAGTLLGGMWQFPLFSVPEGSSADRGEGSSGAVAQIFRTSGLDGEILRAAEPVVHVFSHIRMTVHPVHVRTVREDAAPRVDGYEEARWFVPSELQDTARSALVLKIAAALGR